MTTKYAASIRFAMERKAQRGYDMRKWRRLLLVLVLFCVMVVSVSATQMRTISITVHAKERLNHYTPWVKARSVDVVLFAPEAYGHVIDTCVTNSMGWGWLQGALYEDETFAIWCRRSKPGGSLGLTIPLSYSANVPVDVGYSWDLYIEYTHSTDRMIIGYGLRY